MYSKTPFTCFKRFVPVPLIKDFCILARDALYDYETILLERSTKNPLYCSHPRCSRFVRPDRISPGTDCVQCLHCKKSTCIYYHRGKHAGICKDNKKLHEAIRTLGAKSCPKCNHVIEKAGGCKNMTCRCGYKWCWICGKERDDSGPGCGCVLYG